MIHKLTEIVPKGVRCGMSVKHSLVVPCFNEQDNIEPFLLAVKQAMAGYTDSYEVVFVNDGSTDNTRAVLRAVAEKYTDVCVKVIGFSRNFGKEAAMYAGLQECTGDYVTIIDADLQQPPETAAEMGRLLDAQPEIDMVAAVQQQRKESKLMVVCKNAFYSLINKMTEIDVLADASDFRTLRRSVVEAVLSLSEYHRFSKGLFAWVGFNTLSIPYTVCERRSGESKWSFIKLLRYALVGIMSYTETPLRLPVYLGGGLLTLSLLGALALLLCQLLGGLLVGFWWLADLLVFLASLILLSVGVQGMYLGKVHTQVKQRPIYIAKEKYTNETMDR